MQIPEGRPPAIKKSLFPLFSPKNSIKHSSSVRVLPVVSSPMVPVALRSPPPDAIPPVCLSACLSACINHSGDQDRLLVAHDAFSLSFLFLFMSFIFLTMANSIHSQARSTDKSRASQIHPSLVRPCSKHRKKMRMLKCLSEQICSSKPFHVMHDVFFDKFFFFLRRGQLDGSGWFSLNFNQWTES